MPNLSVRLVTYALVSLAASCDLAVDPNRGWQEMLGVIDESSLTLPEAATAGTPFEVLVTTRGDSCVRGGGTQVILTPGRAEIERRNFVPKPPPENCNSFPYDPQHRVTLRFDQPGPATVVLRGISQWKRTGPLDTLIIERTVLIR